MEPTFGKPVTNTISSINPIEVPIIVNETCMRGRSASFVHHIAFDLSDTPLAGAFQPGQSIGVTPPGQDAQGRPQGARLYSVSSPIWGENGDGRIVTTTCKREIDEFSEAMGPDREAIQGLHLGTCSNYLCSRKVGDTVLVSGPSGKRFLLPDSPADFNYVFVATGTGIAPFRGMIKSLFFGQAGPTRKQVHLVMGVPYTTDLLYDAFFRQTAAQHPNFHYHTVISRELDSNGQPQGYVHDYLARTPEVGTHLLSVPNTLLYLCGLKGMQVGVFKHLVSQGLDTPYLRVPSKLESTDPASWSALEVRRVRPKSNCLVEVY